MEIGRLVAMANDIAAFFDAEAKGAAAVDGVRLHLRKFWEPRMRREIVEYVGRGGEGLCATARAAVEQLAGVADRPPSS
jgi:formate dehydrogenase subunit delta